MYIFVFDVLIRCRRCVFFSLFIHFIRSPSLPFLLRLWHFQYTVWWNLFLCLFVHLRFWNSHYGYFKCFSLSTICLVIDASNNLQICSFKIEWSFDWPCLVPNFSHSFNSLPNFASMWENKREKKPTKEKNNDCVWRMYSLFRGGYVICVLRVRNKRLDFGAERISCKKVAATTKRQPEI